MALDEIDKCIRSNRSRLCGFRKGELFGVNIRNELLKSFIIKKMRSQCNVMKV